jgi:hypothetical protein
MESWLNEAVERFGKTHAAWKFVCPICGYVQSVSECKKAGMEPGAIAFSCIGRWKGAGAYDGTGGGPCNYAGGGLFRLNPVEVIRTGGGTTRVFEFAEEEKADG